MTDQELNEAVARKLGSHWDKQVGWWRFEGQEPTKTPPDYCHSIASAWEILASLVGLHWTVTGPLSTGMIFCRIGDTEGAVTAEADTAPMAICKAFLKLEGK